MVYISKPIGSAATVSPSNLEPIRTGNVDHAVRQLLKLHRHAATYGFKSKPNSLSPGALSVEGLTPSMMSGVYHYSE